MGRAPRVRRPYHDGLSAPPAHRPMARRKRMETLHVLDSMPPWQWPEDASDVVLAALRDRDLDEEDRVLAAELAGDPVAINDELAGVLLSIVGDADEPDALRAAAAISFGPVLDLAYTDEFEEPEAVPITEEVFHDLRAALQRAHADSNLPKDVRRMALEASVRAPEDWHREAVRAAYASDDPDWKVTAVFCMCFVPGFDREILEALESGDEDLEYHAVCAAGTWELEEARPHVARIITSRHDDRSLLLAAIEAITALDPDGAGMMLVELADETDDKEVEEAATEAMVFSEMWRDELVDDE